MTTSKGLAASPWRLLTTAEQNALEHRLPCMRAMQAATRSDLVNGAYQWIFACDGYTIMRQDHQATHLTYWFVYQHPGPLVFGQKPVEKQAPHTRFTLHGVPSMKHTAAHWPGLGSPDGMDDVESADGLGQSPALPNPQNRAEISAAIDFLAYYDTNGCSRASLPVVVALQNAYNASGLPGQLSIDGEYGPNSQRALQNIMDEAQADAGSGPSQQAPANCFPEYGNVPSIPALDRPNAATIPPPTSGSTTLPTTTVTGGAPNNKAILLVGGAAAAVAGGLGYWYWKKHKRGR